MASNCILASNSYGKSRVRFVKLWRGTQHEFKEFDVETTIEGDFDRAYTHSDNSNVIPTDTQKNLVYVVAHENTEWRSAEEYATALVERLLRYGAVRRAAAGVRETCYERVAVGGQAQPLAFRRLAHVRTARAARSRDGPLVLWGGIDNYVLLKTAESGFVDYHRCSHTTLQPKADRFFATSCKIEWRFASLRVVKQADEVANTVRAALDKAFATLYSPSVQATQYWAASAALDAAPEIVEVSVEMPNLHILPLQLSAAGVPSDASVFLPTNEPHGTIRCSVVRRSAKL